MTQYDKAFYDDQQAGSIRSARIAVPHILQLIAPKSVLDVGCGLGTWLSIFREMGVNDLLGLDGDYVNRSELKIPLENFQPADLSKPVTLPRKFDLAISLEVAEHLSADFADTFIDTLTRAAPIVVFSAAIPFQGGTDHRNEQYPEYWADKFRKRGYVAVDVLRDRIWNESNIEICYAQNMLLYVSESVLQSHPIIAQLYEITRDRPLARIHPRMYEQNSAALFRYKKLASPLPAPIKQLAKRVFKRG